MRPAWTAVATLVVAVVSALAVPVSQLRVDKVVIECCCPDPSNCHCPDHRGDHSGQSKLRACHRTQKDVVAPEAPSFVSAPIEITTALPRIAPAPILALPAPHAAPSLDEPYGPS
jgi:hypothetical protein